MDVNQPTGSNASIINKIESSVLQFKPVDIPPDTNFWLVRTKGGRFYNDFFLHNFIALGWNLIDEAFLSSCPEEEKISEQIREQVESTYPRTKNIGYPVNQSRTFVQEMKADDFIIIPAFDDKPVVFGRLIKYYEDDTKTVTGERLFLNDLPPIGEDTLCPYKKRWSVEWIQSRQPEKLNPYLSKLFVSSHGLSKANNYSDYILPAIFDFYEWNNNYHGGFRVERSESIHSRELSGFIYSLDLLCEDLTGSRTFVKSNLNSPGDIIVSIGQTIASLADYRWYYWLLFFVASDISIGPFTVKGIIPYVRSKIKGASHSTDTLAEAEAKLKEAQARKLNAEAEAVEIENEQKRMENAIDTLSACARHLQISPNSAVTQALQRKTNEGEQK